MSRMAHNVAAHQQTFEDVTSYAQEGQVTFKAEHQVQITDVCP